METYLYGPLNNLRQRVSGGVTYTYGYDGTNRLATIGGGGSTSTLGYDSAGDVTSKDGTVLSYDARHQLLSVSGVESYAYDAAGRRVAKTPENGYATHYLYSQAGELLYAWVTATGTYTDYVYLEGKLLARREVSGGAATVTYSEVDGQGTPLAETDASGNVIARYDYAPYGRAVLGAAPDGPGYTGHVNDPGTGLVYMQARYLLPDVHFLSPDPVGPTPGDLYSFNRYAYVNNNPIARTDPTGKSGELVAGELAAEGGAAVGLGCGPFAEICSPVFAGVGFVGGVIVAHYVTQEVINVIVQKARINLVRLHQNLSLRMAHLMPMVIQTPMMVRLIHQW